MRHFLLLLSAGFIAGCTGLGRSELKSEWSVLQESNSADCEIWPMREHDLQLSEVALVGSTSKAGFVVSGQRRDTAAMHYYAPFDGDVDLNSDDFLALSLGRGATPLGGVMANGRELVFIARAVSGKTALEIRSAVDNVVRYKGPLADGVVEDGKIFSVRGGAWITLRSDDGKQQLAYVDLSNPDKIESRPLGIALTTDALRVLPQSVHSDGALLMWKDGESGQPFKAMWMSTTGKATNAVTVDYTVVSQVESWTAVGHAGNYYLAVVDGDSLVGQADLRIAQISWSDGSAETRWTKTLSLKDEHVTEPVFAITSRGLEAMVLKWIDEESTIARYMVAGGTVGKPRHSGIFPKGSRIVDTYSKSGGDDLYVVTRNRGEVGWVFRICEI